MMVAAIRRNTLGDVLRRTAKRDPDKIAIRCGEIEWTYAEFDRLVNQAAGGLAASGVRCGDRIGVLSRNSHYFAVLRFALARLGAVLVPINFMLLAEEVAHILRHSAVTVLCVDTQFAPLGAKACEQGTVVTRMIWLPGERPTPQPAGTVSFEAFLGGGDEVIENDVDAHSVADHVHQRH